MAKWSSFTVCMYSIVAPRLYNSPRRVYVCVLLCSCCLYIIPSSVPHVHSSIPSSRSFPCTLFHIYLYYVFLSQFSLASLLSILFCLLPAIFHFGFLCCSLRIYLSSFLLTINVSQRHLSPLPILLSPSLLLSCPICECAWKWHAGNDPVNETSCGMRCCPLLPPLASLTHPVPEGRNGL